MMRSSEAWIRFMSTWHLISLTKVTAFFFHSVRPDRICETTKCWNFLWGFHYLPSLYLICQEQRKVYQTHAHTQRNLIKHLQSNAINKPFVKSICKTGAGIKTSLQMRSRCLISKRKMTWKELFFPLDVR